MGPESCYDYRYEAPQAKVYTACDVCGEDIFECDSYYEVGALKVCEKCIDSFKKIAGEE